MSAESCTGTLRYSFGNVARKLCIYVEKARQGTETYWFWGISDDTKWYSSFVDCCRDAALYGPGNTPRSEVWRHGRLVVDRRNTLRFALRLSAFLIWQWSWLEKLNHQQWNKFWRWRLETHFTISSRLGNATFIYQSWEKNQGWRYYEPSMDDRINIKKRTKKCARKHQEIYKQAQSYPKRNQSS